MTPIPPGSLLSLIQAGWSAEALLRCCVHSVNGMQNFGQRVQYGRAADPEFVQLLAVLGRVQRAGGMGMRVTRDKDLHTTTLFFRPRKSGPAPEDIAEAGRLLGIDVSAPEYRVSYGSGPKDEREALYRLYARNTVNDETLRVIEEELDARELLSSAGPLRG